MSASSCDDVKTFSLSRVSEHVALMQIIFTLSSS